MPNELIEDEQYPIRPSDIVYEGHFWDAFGHYETEVSAAYIWHLCVERENWQPFTKDEIEAIYQSYGHRDGFTFNRLIEPGYSYGSKGRTLEGGGWIVERDGKYFITEEFIKRIAPRVDEDIRW